MLNIEVCHGCQFNQANQSGFKGGAAACMADPAKRNIKERAAAGDCELFKGGVAVVPAKTPCASRGGPGTELKKLLGKFGIVPSGDCLCNTMASQMDREGGAWCLENIEIIVDVMRSEAAKRKLPFVSAVARMMVRRAVRKAGASNG
jgi:hypothetical protein